jgi:hypothetical protein
MANDYIRTRKSGALLTEGWTPACLTDHVRGLKAHGEESKTAAAGFFLTLESRDLFPAWMPAFAGKAREERCEKFRGPLTHLTSGGSRRDRRDNMP